MDKHNVEYTYHAILFRLNDISRKEILTRATTLMNLVDIMLSERS